MIHVLVADNAKARLFESQGPRAGFKEVCSLVNPAAHLHEQDLVSQRPGRSFNRASGAHQTLDPATSARTHALARWIGSSSATVKKVLVDRNSDGIILIAAPRLLARFTASLRGVPIRGQLAKNLAHLPEASLRRRILPLLSAARASRRAA